MSYFSDTSSTCSAPPLTPSPYHPSSASSSSHGHSHAHAYSSPTPYTPESAPRPDPLKQYSSALKMKMSAGLTAAMKDLKDDRGGPERAFDAEYGYDEDPIERHVRLFLTPRKAPMRSKAVPELGLGMRPMTISHIPIPPPPIPATASGMSRPVSLMVQAAGVEKVIPSTAPRPSAYTTTNTSAKENSHITVEDEKENIMLAPPSADEYAMLDQDSVPARFRPGLIHFHRSNSSSLDPPRPPYSRMNSDVSTGSSNFDLQSEASFEAVRAEDIISMYATSDSTVKEDPFGVHLEEEMGRASMDSQDTYATIRTATARHVSSIPSAMAQIQPLQVYTQPTHSLTHAQASTPPHFVTRPSFTRKRSRVHPYENPSLTTTAINTNSQSDSRPSPAASGLTPNEAPQPAWLADRTVSEQMVALAGLRCQRQRVGATRVPS